MKKLILVALMLSASCIVIPAHGQGRHKNFQDKSQRADEIEYIRSLKVAYLTERLHLTAEQAESFWPVYNKYEKEIRSTRKEFFQKYRHNDADENEKTSLQFIDDNIDYQQKVLDIKRNYKDEFLRVISAQQLVELYKSEREFKEYLIHLLREHKNQNHFDRDEDRLNNRDRY